MGALETYRGFLPENALEKDSKFIRDLSSGNAKKVGIVAALFIQPEIVILDEPFAGLDADSVAVMEDMLTDYLARGCMVVVTSHQKIGCSAKAIQHINLDS